MGIYFEKIRKQNYGAKGYFGSLSACLGVTLLVDALLILFGIWFVKKRIEGGNQMLKVKSKQVNLHLIVLAPTAIVCIYVPF